MLYGRPPQISWGAVIDPKEATVALNAMVSALDTCCGEEQTALLYKMTFTTSLFFKPVVTKVLLLLATVILFTCHKYPGAFPPLSGVAVNVTLVSLHIAVGDLERPTEGLTDGVREMLIT